MTSVEKIANYGSPAKEVYRQNVHNFFDANSGKPVSSRKLVYLDTSSAFETAHALKRGYRTDLMYCVNKSSAQLAWVTMNSGSRVNTRTGDVFDVMSALKSAGTAPDVVNLDMCGPVNSTLLRNLAQFNENIAMPGTVCSVTVLRARDSKEFLDRNACSSSIIRWAGVRSLDGSLIASMDALRVSCILRGLSGLPSKIGTVVSSFDRVKWDTYKSGKDSQPMLWVAVRYAK